MFDMKALGKSMRHIRKIKGLTQEELAKKAGLSTMSIRRYENGERIITEKALYRIANALEVQMYDFSAENDAIDTNQFPWWPLRPPRIMTEEEITQIQKNEQNPERVADSGNVYAMLAYSFGYSFSKNERKTIKLLSMLNDDGQQKAVERVEELTEIPRYRAETTPKSTPAPTEGKDTTPPPGAPETPPEGE